MGIKRRLKTNTDALEVHVEDWQFALTQVKPSSIDKAFGNSSTSLRQLPPGVRLLLESNMKRIEDKFEPILTDIKHNCTVNGSGGLNSFLIASDSENDVDSYLVPLLLTQSKQFKDVTSHTLDLSDVMKLSKEYVQGVLTNLHLNPEGKIPMLLVPQIDTFIKMKGSLATIPANIGMMVDYVLSELQSLRGKNVILLATSKLSFKTMQQIDQVITIFKGMSYP